MGVYYKLKTKDGGESTKKKGAGCWGVLKYDLTRGFRGSLNRIKSAEEDYSAYAEEFKEVWGDKLPLQTLEEYTTSVRNSCHGIHNIDPVHGVSGISEIVVCKLFKRYGRLSDSETMGFHLDGLHVVAYKTLVGAYPKLFNCITNVDFEEGEITVNFEEHYAIVYNVLRMIKKFAYLNKRCAEAMVDNPALSLFLLDAYSGGARASDDSEVFTISRTNASVISNMIDRRDWFITDKIRNNKAHNASLRSKCCDKGTDSLGYVKIVDPDTSSAFSHSIYDRYLPRTIESFITQNESYKGVA